MKKIIAGLLVVAMMSMVACSGGQSNKETESQTETAAAVEIASPLEVLEKVWDTYEESEMFPIGGGDYNNMVMDAPGECNPADTEAMDAMLHVPAEEAAKLISAASMMHMMNANTFTAGVYELNMSDDMQGFADAMKDSLANTQWMCGFPEKMLIVSINEYYVAVAFGNGELIDTFNSKLAGVYETASVLVDEAIE